MRTSKAGKAKEFSITYVLVSNDEITVSLNDGRRLTFPLSWYPRLKHGSPAERNTWELMGGGYGVYWPELNETLSVDGFLQGNPSFESPKSFKRWLSYRARGMKEPVLEFPLSRDEAKSLREIGIDAEAKPEAKVKRRKAS